MMSKRLFGSRLITLAEKCPMLFLIITIMFNSDYPLVGGLVVRKA